MSTYEGEVVLKEKYGSSSKYRLFIKPADKSDLVILNEEKSSGPVRWLTKVFLPHGYPDSVSNDYLAYQIWDTAQAFCSTITGTLATQEVLRGVGVGDTAATPLAATLTWVLKDSCGHVGRILFAFTHGTMLDAYSKKWRLYADALNDAAMLIEITLPYFNKYITFALCVSTTMKAIVGVAGGATRVAMTQHHAIRGNMADVAAKDSAQETAVNLLASLFAVLLITAFGYSMPLFIFILVLHITCNYMAVRSVCLKTLNEPRFLQVIHSYLSYEVIPAPCYVNNIEPIIFYQIGHNVLDLKISGFYIKLGHSLRELMRCEDVTSDYLSTITDIYSKRSYIIFPCVENRVMYVFIKETADVDAVLRAYFHAVLLAIIVSSINNEPMSVCNTPDSQRPFAIICELLAAEDWSREPLVHAPGPSGFMFKPTYSLMEYIDKMVIKEWIRVRTGLIKTGWDLNKHLIICDEWRIHSNTDTAGEARVLTGISVGDFYNTHSASQFTPFDSALQEIERDELFPDNFTVEPSDTVSDTSLPEMKEQSTKEMLTSMSKLSIDKRLSMAVDKRLSMAVDKRLSMAVDKRLSTAADKRSDDSSMQSSSRADDKKSVPLINKLEDKKNK